MDLDEDEDPKEPEAPAEDDEMLWMATTPTSLT
jgi:hypothetical protein